MDESHRVLVLGLDERNRQTMTDVCGGFGCSFHPLLSVEELLEAEELPLQRLLDKAERQVAEFDGPVDAIVGYWDFPVSTMVPILCERFGLRGASLRAVLACEHKYWSRLEQRRAIAEHPAFGLVRLGDERPPDGVDYPLWLKPVKAFSSELAFRVDDDEQFRSALRKISEGIARVGEPFQWILDQVDLPREITEAGGEACLAEAAVGGQQLTVEGYSTGTDIHVYGIIDSHTYEGTSSFECYQYPSTLPEPVRERLADISRRVIEQIGLRSSPFNIEYFWERETDTISLLEVNPRHSQSHAMLFDYVDGAPNHRVMIRLALGLDPSLPRRGGEHAMAAKYFVRRFADGVARRVPTNDEIAAAIAEVGGVAVDVLVQQGQRLSELPEQDSYSYALAEVHVGGRDPDELRSKYERCLEGLPFEFDDETGPAADHLGAR